MTTRKTPDLAKLSRRQLIALRKQVDREIARKRRDIEDQLSMLIAVSKPKRRRLARGAD
jgi:hypothetical protein